MALYCTMCATELKAIEVEGAEANLICENGHKWWYSPIHAVNGDVLAFHRSELGFQCDLGEPVIEVMFLQTEGDR